MYTMDRKLYSIVYCCLQRYDDFTLDIAIFVDKKLYFLLITNCLKECNDTFLEKVVV